ncbi:MAG TPA: hypothetical protein VIV08_07130 [Acidimicrobiia bacterium]
MDLDPTEGEPRRTENVRSGGGSGGRSPSGPDWPRWPLFAVSTVFAGLALWTGWAWLTFFSAGALLAGLTVNAWGTSGVRPRLSLLTLRSWWARWSWRAILAVESRLPNPVYARRARRPWWSRDPRQPARTRWSRGPDAAPRRARGTDDAVDDRPGEGERR